MVSKSGAHPPWLRDVFALQQAKNIDRQHRLLVEGQRLTRAAFAADLPFERVVFAPEYFDEPARALVSAIGAAGVPTHRLASTTFRRLSYKAEGVLGVVRFRPPAIDDVLRAPLVVVLDALSDPGNIGAVLRTVDAWGPAGVIVVDGQTKLFHPKALRASMGAVFHTPTCVASRAAAIDRIATRGGPVVSFTPDGGPFASAQAGAKEAVVVFGNEKRGVHPDWERVTTARLAIPTVGIVDSLNVATAASVVLWEAFRARSAPRANGGST